MKPGYECVCRNSAGNLHVDLYGEFNGRCAWELFKLLKQHGGARRVFVNTAGIRQIAGEGVQLFRSYMTRPRIQHDWLYFKGEKGFKIAPNGSRVLICKKNLLPIINRPKQKRKRLRLVKNVIQS